MEINDLFDKTCLGISKQQIHIMIQSEHHLYHILSQIKIVYSGLL